MTTTVIEENAKVYIGLLKDYELRAEYSKLILGCENGEERVFEFNEKIKIFRPMKDELIMLIIQESGNLLSAKQTLICFTEEERIAYYRQLGVKELPVMLRLFDERSKEATKELEKYVEAD